MTPGAFRLNHATVLNNATLFEGATIETGAAPSRMDLASGTRLELEPESAGRVFGDIWCSNAGQLGSSTVFCIRRSRIRRVEGAA